MTELEKKTQERVIRLFADELGYRFLGDWRDREGNSCIEEELLTANLLSRGGRAESAARAVYLLRQAAEHPALSLLQRNREGLRDAALRGAGKNQGGGTDGDGASGGLGASVAE